MIVSSVFCKDKAKRNRRQGLRAKIVREKGKKGKKGKREEKEKRKKERKGRKGKAEKGKEREGKAGKAGKGKARVRWVQFDAAQQHRTEQS